MSVGSYRSNSSRSTCSVSGVCVRERDRENVCVCVCVCVSAVVAALADEVQRLWGSGGHPSSPSGLSEALWTVGRHQTTTRAHRSELD